MLGEKSPGWQGRHPQITPILVGEQTIRKALREGILLRHALPHGIERFLVVVQGNQQGVLALGDFAL